MAASANGSETVDDVGPLIPFDVRNGQNAPIPLRGVSSGHDAVRSLVAGKLNPDLPLLTYRAKGETIVLTLRDLKLAP